MQLETCQAPLSSHLNTRIFSLACAAYPGAHIILSYWDNTEQFAWGKPLAGDVFKCSNLHRLKVDDSLGALLKCDVDML